MKIAINAGILDDKPSGLGTYTINIIPELMRVAGKDLVIYTSSPDMLSNVSGCEIKELSTTLQPKHGKKAGLARFIWNQVGFPLTLRGVDMVYCPTHHGMLWGSVGQVITIHDLLPMKFPNQYRLQNHYFTYILPRLIRKAAAVVTISNNTREDLLYHYDVPPEKIHVIHNGINQVQFTPQSDAVIQQVKQKHDLHNYFLVVGASYPHKNIERALRAFAKIRPQLQGVELAIVGGRKEYIDILKHEAEELGTHGIRFIDYVPFEELPALYAGSTAFVYPSLYEGFGAPPLEAMACGCAVIVSNTSSLPEVCGDAALQIDPNDIESIAAAMHTVAADTTLQEQLCEKGLAHVKRFQWSKTAAGVYGLISKIYEENKR